MALRVDSFESADALVTTKRRQSHQRGPDTMIVEYEFRVDGEWYDGDNVMTRISDGPEEVEKMVRREGGRDRLRIWYDPGDPSVSVIRNDISVWRPLGMIALPLLLLVGGAQAYRTDKKRRKLQERADEARRRKEEERAARRSESPPD